MDIAIKVLESSKLYQKVHDQWQNNPIFKNNIDRVLGSNSKMLMVIYALGSIESSYRSRFQLALAILLKRDFSDWIGNIEAYDPIISDTDAKVIQDTTQHKVMEALGCNVLSVNEECKRQIEKPTLFYMPYGLNEHKGDLLETNWCPSRLNQMILLTVGFKHLMGIWRDLDDNPTETTFFRRRPHHTKEYYLIRERVDYIEAIQKHTVEFAMTKKYQDYENPLNHFSCHFFNLDQQLDMASLMPGTLSLSLSLSLSLMYTHAHILVVLLY
ncbi:hypothetical protein NE237_017436 [Protea cynaroides]|uniref:SRR1-like domain-containing protein n=1 Tax=Protea cynaroides TaxID=273540 RepID=A0A9Q0K819_9MAGN|nr:hypothetical protein NE237_017436 [Protea cynaroides]